MFDRVNVHLLIALVWLALFALLWWWFQYYLLNGEALAQNLNAIEDNIIKEEWEKAGSNYRELKRLWDKKRLGLQFNNGTPVVTSFEREMAQLGVMIDYKKSDALVHIGGLRKDLKDATTVFPGP